MDAKTKIVYSPKYNLGAPGLQKLHPFDGRKFARAWKCIGKAFPNLAQAVLLNPEPASEQQLLRVHTRQYLDELDRGTCLADIFELPFRLPSVLLKQLVLKPMRWATGGTIAAADWALTHGLCVNLGGGFHHASRDRGEGFCAYADVPVAIEELRQRVALKRIMIVDLDAHQGNGFERVYADDPSVAVFDVYNGDVYPQDRTARAAIRWDHCLASGVKDAEYLNVVEEYLPLALDEFQPELIFYVAGTDIYQDDPLGQMSISAAGVLKRDCLVFNEARQRSIPLVMTLGGGYTPVSFELVAQSVKYLLESST